MPVAYPMTVFNKLQAAARLHIEWARRDVRREPPADSAALPETLLESELFGYERGAFTGALQMKPGQIELASGGVLFLDEVSELRVLQERQLERVGGHQAIPVNVRVIAATNRDLRTAISEGEFRSDLFYRLNVFPIHMPPLRARKKDIPLLVEHFVEWHARKHGRKPSSISPATLDRLMAYDWPGNIRELQNVVERAFIISDGGELCVDPSWIPSALETQEAASDTLTMHQKKLIESALAETGGRVSGPGGAAAKLGMKSSTLESKIRSLNIDKRRFKIVYDRPGHE